MLKYLQSEWTALTLGNIIYVIVLILAFSPPAPEAEESPEPVVAFAGKSWDFHNPEVEHLIEELKARKTTLDRKEIDLNETESRLHAERAELDLVTTNVQRLQEKFDLNVMRLEAAEVANIKKIAKTYSLMDPAAAAGGLRSMDNDTVAKILRVMKQSDAAMILQLLGQGDPKRVGEISDRMRLALDSPAPSATPAPPASAAAPVAPSNTSTNKTP